MLGAAGAHRKWNKNNTVEWYWLALNNITLKNKRISNI